MIKKYDITYKGKTLTTIHNPQQAPIGLMEKVKGEFYQKPTLETVKNEMQKVHTKGRVMTTNIRDYYFKELMTQTKLYHSHWTVSDVFESSEIFGYFYARTLKNKKMFNGTDIQNINKILGIGGKGVATMPTNFPIKTARIVLDKYNINNVVYDFSCGWGIRLLASMEKGLGYLGTDPNKVLTEKLVEMAQDYAVANNIKVRINIKNTGSEYFHQEWTNKVGLCFSSPPYFKLEQYNSENQSVDKFPEYTDWLEHYLKPTLENCKAYLIEDGVLALNINNYGDYDLVGDAITIAEQIGFKYIESITLKNNLRINCKSKLNDNSEQVMIFKKA